MGRISGYFEMTDGGDPPAGVEVNLYFKHRDSGQKCIWRAEAQQYTWQFEKSYPEDDYVPLEWTVTHPGYWTNSGKFPRDTENMRILLEKIHRPRYAPHLAWWHDALHLKKFNPALGKGIGVVVIDSGCCGDHPCLSLDRLGPISVGDGALEVGEMEPLYTAHGTHVCGILGAIPHEEDPDLLGGVAPGASLLSIQLKKMVQRTSFREDFSGLEPVYRTYWSLADLANSIQYVVKLRKEGRPIHLINLSLALPAGGGESLGVRNAIRAATKEGILCVIAAGNHGQANLAFPASCPEAVSVASIGMKNSGPSWRPSIQYPKLPSRIADPFYLAEWSNHGEGLSCCAPGVGIVSTVPVSSERETRPYLDMTGTSMATPMVVGSLAVRLAERWREYGGLRGTEQAEYARGLLPAICRDLGFARNVQGNGMIFANKSD